MEKESILRKLKENKKPILVFSLILLSGIITSVIIFITLNETCICANYDEKTFPYEYKREPPYDKNDMCVFPDYYIYTNSKIYWMFEMEYTPVIVIIMNAENYYTYEKLAFHREDGKIICHDGQFLPYVNYYIMNVTASLFGEGYWKAPYLDWWCSTFVNAELKPTDSYGTYGLWCKC